MPDEAKQTEGQAQEPKADSPADKPAKGGMLKLIIFGVVAIIVVMGGTVGALYFMGGSSADTATEVHEEPVKKEQSKPPVHHETTGEQAAVTEGSEFSEEDLGLSEEDQSAIDRIMDNLDFLDYEPSDDEMAAGEGRMTKEDSLAQVNWLDKEKAALAQKEKELNSRQKELDRLEKEINKKVVNLEQAESARTAQLAKLYDGMDARSVARLMANLDDKTVVSILPRMKLKNASAVLQLLPAQRAAKLSKQMITIAGK